MLVITELKKGLHLKVLVGSGTVRHVATLLLHSSSNDKFHDVALPLLRPWGCLRAQLRTCTVHSAISETFQVEQTQYRIPSLKSLRVQKNTEAKGRFRYALLL